MATIFAVLDLAFHDALQPEPTDERASTVPFPADIGRYRGSPPTFVVDLQASFEETPNAIRDFHDLGQQLPSIYRTFVQWTSYLERAWADLGRCSRAPPSTKSGRERMTTSTASSPRSRTTPRLAPADLGPLFDDGTVADLLKTVRTFNSDAVETVLPALPVFAAAVDVEVVGAHFRGGNRGPRGLDGRCRRYHRPPRGPRRPRGRGWRPQGTSARPRDRR